MADSYLGFTSARALRLSGGVRLDGGGSFAIS